MMQIEKCVLSEPLGPAAFGWDFTFQPQTASKGTLCFVMWGLRGVHVGFSVPYPPLVCGPPGRSSGVLLCEFRDGLKGKVLEVRKSKPQGPAQYCLGGRVFMKWRK